MIIADPPLQLLKYYFVWSMILNTYIGQRIIEGSENKVMWDNIY